MRDGSLVSSWPRLTGGNVAFDGEGSHLPVEHGPMNDDEAPRRQVPIDSVHAQRVLKGLTKVSEQRSMCRNDKRLVDCRPPRRSLRGALGVESMTFL